MARPPGPCSPSLLYDTGCPAVLIWGEQERQNPRITRIGTNQKTDLPHEWWARRKAGTMAGERSPSRWDIGDTHESSRTRPASWERTCCAVRDALRRSWVCPNPHCGYG